MGIGKAPWIGVCRGNCHPSLKKLLYFDNYYFQLRLDFDTFTITGPSTLTTSTVKIISGVVAGDGKEASGASQCSTDLFSVTNPGGSTPPAICGTNTGEHSMSYKGG